MSTPPCPMSALIRIKASSEAKMTVTYPTMEVILSSPKMTLNFNVVTLKFNIYVIIDLE